jgi:hypothetical protein
MTTAEIDMGGTRMTLQRWLATLVWSGTAGIVICVEVIAARELIAPDHPNWWFLSASGAVAVVTALYMRWLAPQLNSRGRPRWRLGTARAQVLLPPTAAGLVLAAGVASSTYWPDWVGSAIGAAAALVFAQYLLRRAGYRSSGD